MKMPKIVLLSALVSCALLSGCKDDKASQVTIEFMHSSVEQERQAVITKLIEKFEKENPTITVKQVPVEEDAYNTKVITLARTGALPEVIEVSHDYAKVMDKEQLLDRDAIGNAIKAVGEDTFYDGILRVVRTEDGKAWTGVPVSAWLSGVWYHKDALAAAGIEEPHNWEQLLKASQSLNDPAKKHYGIALPTAESVMTEQAFSQFALSGGANVFDANGNVKIATQNQTFFPTAIMEKFEYIKAMGFDGYEIDGRLLVENLDEVKAAIKATGLPVTTACGGYDGWIGDFIEERRLNGLQQIERILEALAEVGGKGIIVPAAWGMFTFRLPPMTSPRSLDGDRKAVSASLRWLDEVAARTGTTVYLEPLNRYQDHMINTLADARRYIEENGLKHVQIIGDFYHMNIEEDSLTEALHQNRDLLGHVHIADNHRYQPGSGSLDFASLFDQLRADNYQGYVVYECRVRADDPAQAYKDSLTYLREC